MVVGKHIGLGKWAGILLVLHREIALIDSHDELARLFSDTADGTDVDHGSTPAGFSE